MGAEEKWRIGLSDGVSGAAKGIKSSLGGLGSQLGSLKGQFAAMVGVAAMGAFVQKTMDVGDELHKLNLKLGVSTEALSEYKHVADLSGVAWGTFTKALQQSTRIVSEAASGLGAGKDALKELGLEAEELNKLEPDRRFEKLADALMGVASEADRVRLAEKLFGGKGASVLQMMQDGSEGLRAMRQEAQDLGLSMSLADATKMADFNDSVTRLKGSLTGLGQDIVVELADPMMDVATSLRNVIHWLTSPDMDFRRWIGRVAGAGDQQALEELMAERDRLAARQVEIQSDKSVGWLKSVEEFFVDRNPTARLGRWITEKLGGESIGDVAILDEYEDLMDNIKELDKVIDRLDTRIHGRKSIIPPIVDPADDPKKTVAAVKDPLEALAAQIERLVETSGEKYLRLLAEADDLHEKNYIDANIHARRVEQVWEAYAKGADFIGPRFESLGLQDEAEETVDTVVDAMSTIDKVGEDAARGLADAFIESIRDVRNAFEALENFAINIMNRIAEVLIQEQLVTPLIDSFNLGGDRATDTDSEDRGANSSANQSSGSAIPVAANVTIVANDTRGFAELVTSRASREAIGGIVVDTLTRSGRPLGV